MVERDHEMVGARQLFPLRPADEVDHIGEIEATVGRPFGLRYMTEPVGGRPVDFSNWDYDHERQIAVVHEGGHVIEAGKHSTGPTQTPTSREDSKTKYERDQDYTED